MNFVENWKDLYHFGEKNQNTKIILYHLNCNYKFIKYVCMKTKTGGKYTGKNIVLGDGWILFPLFQKCHLISSHLKLK